ncbi:capsular exopolysaccharide family [Singulisphaera sp. GP187]|uniref:GumC family protein n=1 Tax=Singulisphaera sp. GP187 TaxID=1882752 RepID=UPI000929346A|nr:polysaccharide biosynthesis tyrosine autokinase [Singulisphaera sp. GP187]SIN92059.1 capsular exopolysaccharide family [Singulisphaera sp. GP187]
MDGTIQGYAGPPRSPNFQTAPTQSNAGKSASDYLRALRRRIWFVLAIGVPLSILCGIVIAYQPNVYSAKTQIAIEAPHFDPVLSSLVSPTVGHEAPESSETYGPNRIAMLRSPRLADQVVNDPSLTHGAGASTDAAEELVAAIQTRPVTGTNQYTVTLEGRDPVRVAKSLQLLIDAFKNQASDEINQKIDNAKQSADGYLTVLKHELSDINKSIIAMVQDSEVIGPGGKNIKERTYELLTSSIQNDQNQLRDLNQQSYLSQAFPNARNQAPSDPYAAQKSELGLQRETLVDTLSTYKSKVRNFDHDPAVLHTAKKLQGVVARLKRLNALSDSSAGAAEGNPYDSLADAKKEELRQKEEMAKTLLDELQASMPTYQRYTDSIDRLRLKQNQIAEMEKKIWEFSAISQGKKDPVIQVASVAEPTQPIRPKRALNMIFALILSFGLGIGVVCLLEHIDHSIKAPEQLTAALTLPLFGVIPKIRRSALLHRGGHLWTPGAPDSIEADAFRNLRASLIGITDKRGPIVTLLVTSAKAGEGKSTTALNLAATCARAGERTLLMDVDLRRPSLAGVFQDLDEEGSGLGLVDVLRGDLPWQRTVVRTDIPNLDFLPTGDTTGVPIEILGALELRQLIIGLSSHYDRVILDGPAILGLADCRMLGRIVDASLLVVRSGSQELRPLQHAKAMLEQSHVMIAGVVFNGLYEDLRNWSSYGPETPYGYTGSITGRSAPAAPGLDAPSEEQTALPMATSL